MKTCIYCKTKDQAVFQGVEHLIPQSFGKFGSETPTECERLQGFPDGWTDGVSDTQRYKTLGNAVTVNVIEAVVSLLLQPRAQ